MAKSGLTWNVSPIELAKEYEAYGYVVLIAIRAAAAKWGQDVQDQARQEAPWKDRTGNARSGIFYAVDGFGKETIQGEISKSLPDSVKLVSGQIIERGRKVGTIQEAGDKDTLIVIVGHSVFYGRFLELSNGGRYAVILSTMERNLPNLERMIRQAIPQ